MGSGGRGRGGEDERYLYPHLLFEIICICLVVLEVVLLLALASPPPVRRQVNLAFPYSPRPAWYFLPLYELVKFFPGRWTFLGASLLPLLFLGLLYGVPWFDGGSDRSLRARTWPVLAAVAAVAGLLFLLLRGWRS